MFRFHQIYGQEHPRAWALAQQPMLSPGSPHHDWKTRLRRRQASPPHTPAQHFVAHEDSSDDEAHTPGAPIKHDAHHVAREDELAFGPGHWVHAAPPPVFLPAEKHFAHTLLIRPPQPCPWWKPKTQPQHNAAAHAAGLHEKPIKVVDWDDIHPHEVEDIFLNALFREDAYHYHVRKGMSEKERHDAVERHEREHDGHPFPHLATETFPNFSRPLAKEADAAELFCTNVALGVRDTLNLLLRQDLVAQASDRGIRVEIESQARVGEGHDASALDFNLSLVSWPLNIKQDAFRFHLVSVEMKRPGYVTPSDWLEQDDVHGPKSNGRAHALATQLFWYTRRDPQQIERHLVSDFINSVAVAVEKDSVHENHTGDVIMATFPITCTNVGTRLRTQQKAEHHKPGTERPSFENPIDNPFEGGPRLALLYLAFEALRAYGVLNPYIFPGVDVWEQPDPKTRTRIPKRIPVHPAINAFVRAAPAGSRHDPHAPSLSPTRRGNVPHSNSNSDDDERELQARLDKLRLAGHQYKGPHRRHDD
ncbi:hypothetical protein JCM10908_000415 [Rhodotorula pacifica]|uniref:uncharacterized protein n=1 Tax=Rhodotorula pacifica TaxID=1495444 RepID=UPI003171AAF9